MIRAILLLLILTSNTFAQIELTASKVITITGVKDPQIIGGNLLVGPGSQPKLSEAAIVKVIAPAKFVQVKARKSLAEFAPMRKLSDKEHLLEGSGRYLIEVTTFDPNIGIDSAVLEVVLGESPPEPKPEPDDPDGPTPGPVPDDEFGNIGKRVAGWANGLPKRKEVAVIYRDSAKQLRENPIVTVNTVSADIVTKRNALLGADSSKYQALVGNLNTDLKARWPLAKGTLADYFDRIATGLEAAQ